MSRRLPRQVPPALSPGPMRRPDLLTHLLLLPPAPRQFPYPIMNKLPAPLGFVGFFSVGMAVVLGAFELGALVKRGGRGRGRRPKAD